MIKVEIGNAVLDGYKAATRKDTLDVYSIFTIKCTEEGQPTLLANFDDKDSPFLSKIGDLARNDLSKVYKIPLNEPMHVDFSGTEFDANLREIGVQRNFKTYVNTYTFTFEKVMDGNELKDIVIPYLKARELVTGSEPDAPGGKQGKEKYETIKYNVKFTNEEN